MNTLLHEITSAEEWKAAQGPEEYEDGSAPLAAFYGPLTVVCECNGLTAWTKGHEAEFIFIEANREYAIDMASKILADCKGMTPNQMLRHINSL